MGVLKADLGMLCNRGIARGCQMVAEILGHQKSGLEDGQREMEPPRRHELSRTFGGWHLSYAGTHRTFTGREKKCLTSAESE